MVAETGVLKDPEVHRVLVEKVFPRQADVVTSEQLADLLAAPLS
ncbi:MAG TPA: hypothetical protein VGJ14_10235 [Sporichthyaceae bacterium]